MIDIDNCSKYLVSRASLVGTSRGDEWFYSEIEIFNFSTGPDVVICDEGHILKNSDTAVSKAVSKVRTRRRIVLTGTPLQNNLIECK